MLHGCPPSPDAWGRLNVVTPFHHLSGDSHINSSLREGPLRHLLASRALHPGYFRHGAAENGGAYQYQPGVCAPDATCLPIPQPLKGRRIMVVADEDVAK